MFRRLCVGQRAYRYSQKRTWVDRSPVATKLAMLLQSLLWAPGGAIRPFTWGRSIAGPFCFAGPREKLATHIMFIP
jgi:hypothetical protein